MKTGRAESEASGFTLIELLVVIAIVAVLAAIMLPAITDRPRPAYRVRCMSNLRQIDLGFIMYASDYSDKFPMQVPVENGGTMELVDAGHAFPHFEKIYKYMPGPQLYK